MHMRNAVHFYFYLKRWRQKKEAQPCFFLDDVSRYVVFLRRASCVVRIRKTFENRTDSEWFAVKIALILNFQWPQPATTLCTPQSTKAETPIDLGKKEGKDGTRKCLQRNARKLFLIFNLIKKQTHFNIFFYTSKHSENLYIPIKMWLY